MPQLSVWKLLLFKALFHKFSEEGDKKAKKANENNKQVPEQFEIASPLDQRFTFDSFVVGKPNALAHAAARRVVESVSCPI